MVGNVYPLHVDIFRTERFNTLDARAQKMVVDYMSRQGYTDPDGRWHYDRHGNVFVTQYGRTTKIGVI